MKQNTSVTLLINTGWELINWMSVCVIIMEGHERAKKIL